MAFFVYLYILSVKNWSSECWKLSYRKCIKKSFFSSFWKILHALCLLRYSIIGPTTLLATISEKMVNTEGISIPTWDLKMRARFRKISNLDCRVCSCRNAMKVKRFETIVLSNEPRIECILCMNLVYGLSGTFYFQFCLKLN